MSELRCRMELTLVVIEQVLAARSREANYEDQHSVQTLSSVQMDIVQGKLSAGRSTFRRTRAIRRRL